jgi:hypothetical protein
MAAFIMTASGSVDIGQPYQDAFDVVAAGVERKADLPVDVRTHRLGQGKIACLYFDLHRQPPSKSLCLTRSIG